MSRNGTVSSTHSRKVRVVAEVCDRCGYLEEPATPVETGEELIAFGQHCGRPMRGISRGELRKRTLEAGRVVRRRTKAAARVTSADSPPADDGAGGNP
jgi:hypothetical protein